MEAATIQAIYTNLWLLASADGKLVSAERAYLDKVTKALGISPADAERWRADAQAEGARFLPPANADEAEAALTIAARMVRVDDEFTPAEQEAFIALGKAFGIAPDALGPVLRNVWSVDPDTLLKAVAPVSPVSGAQVLVLGGGAPEREAVVQAAPSAALTFRSTEELSSVRDTPRAVIFHVLDDRNASERLLAELHRRFPALPIAFIARRDQAPQIGNLLGLGAARCFVAPLYPNEIEKALPVLLAPR